MKKMLSLALAVLMILSVFSFPAIADSKQKEDAGQFLKELGIIKGGKNGDLIATSHLKREEAVRMLGKEDEAIKNFKEKHKEIKIYSHTNDKHKDEKSMDEKYQESKYKDHKEFILLSVENLNYDKLILKFNQDISEKDIEDLGITSRIWIEEKEKIILTVLDVDEKILKIQVNKNLQMGKKYKLKAKNLVAQSGAVLTPVEIKFELDTKVTSNSTQNTNDENQFAQKPFKVKQIVADNLKDIKIIFNQNISQTTVQEEVPTGAEVKPQFQFIGDDLGQLKITDIEDKYVIVEIEKAFETDKEYSIYVGGIKSETGEILKGEVHNFKVENLDAPSVSNIEPAGFNMLIIDFSEPILETGKIIIGKVGQRPIEVSGEAIAMKGRRAVVTLPANFEDQVEYEVEVRGFFDYEKKANKKAKERFVFDEHSVYIKD